LRALSSSASTSSPARGLAAEDVEVAARARVATLVETIGDERRVRLGHDQRLAQLMRDHGGERLERALLALELVSRSISARRKDAPRTSIGAVAGPSDCVHSMFPAVIP
jgi:hypothetical protein